MLTKFTSLSVTGVDLSQVNLDEIYLQLLDWEGEYAQTIHIYDLFEILERASAQLEINFLSFLDLISQ